MGSIIENAVMCNSWYGMVCVLGYFVFLYLTIHYALPLLCDFFYKTICKICNTYKTYDMVYAKIEVDDVSIETDLNR